MKTIKFLKSIRMYKLGNLNTYVISFLQFTMQIRGLIKNTYVYITHHLLAVSREEGIFSEILLLCIS